MILSLSAGATVLSPGPRPDSPLLLIMHGYGADERDLTGLVPHLPAHLSTASVRAPLALPSGYAWVPIVDPGRPDPDATRAAARAVLHWVAEHVPDTTEIALLGFSQGGLMVSQLLREAPARFAAGVVLSGFVAEGAEASDAELARLAPPVFFGRGDRDPIIGVDAFERASSWLGDHTTLTEVVYPGLGHGISGPEVAAVADFLARHVPDGA